MSKWSPEWQLVPLHELAEFRNGINFSSANAGRGIKVVGVSNFQNYLDVPYDELGEINPNGVVRQEDLLQENDFVFVRSNGNRELIGRSLFVRNLPYDVTHSGFTIRLRFIAEGIVPEFFAQVFRSEIIRDAISSKGSGTNISNLSQQILGNLEVPLPPLPEQRKIAAILSTWDEAITLTEQLIGALQRRKQALMQLLLTGAVRFPEFEGEWEEVELRELVDALSGGTPSKENPDFWSGNIPWISAKSMYSIYVGDSEDKVTLQGTQNGTRLVPASTVLILVRGSMLYKRVPICITTQEVAFNQDLKALIPRSNLLPEYLLYSLIGQETTLLSRVEVTGMGAGKLSSDILLSTPISLPNLREQGCIADCLKLLEDELELQRAYLEQLQEQKRGLMQQLITGAVRVIV